MLQPWMRVSEGSPPVPTPAERVLAYAALRGCVDNTHNEASELDEGDLVHIHPGSYCMESLTLEVDSDGGTITLSRRASSTGPDEYKAVLILGDTQHEYVCDETLETVRRTDEVIDMEAVDTSRLDEEIAALLGGEPITVSRPEGMVAQPGVTVGLREIGVLIGVISQATYLPRPILRDE